MYEDIKKTYPEIPLGRAKDLSQKKFTKLKPLYRTPPPKNRGTYWVCKCDCSNIITVDAASLTSNRTKSCGCLIQDKKNTYENEMIGKKIGHWTILKRIDQRNWLCQCDCEHKTENIMRIDSMTKSLGCKFCNSGKNAFVDLTGQKINHWNVIKYNGNINGHSMWLCKCDCENQTIRSVDAYKLKNNISTSCGCVSRSKGEQKIIDLLKNNNILFEEQKQFNNCKTSDNGYARFDFYINNKYLVEYDGSQHFVLASNKGWNSVEKLKRTQERDMIKNEWCKENNIPLIRIPYTHLNKLCLEDLLLETTKFRVI